MGLIMYRGSRKHVLDWTGHPKFLTQLAEMLAPLPLNIPGNTAFMPRGFESPAEARLEHFGPKWLSDSSVWGGVEDWWLCYKAGANTPNWDIAVGCEIEGRPGLVLVEAKANWRELGVGGKRLKPDASPNSRENHKRIGNAIEQALNGWRILDGRVSISSDSHYQLANRLAFTWKLAMLGIPVILIYLGFTGDDGIADAGKPFANHADWQAAFDSYVAGSVPHELFDRRLEVDSTPVWLLSRSREIIQSSPRRVSR